MKPFLQLSGNAAAVLGALICLLAGLARIAGIYHVIGFEAMTLFMGGLGLMVFGCLAKLELIRLELGNPRS